MRAPAPVTERGHADGSLSRPAGEPGGRRELSPPPFVSVIVPCRDEERYIGPCLDSILATDYPPSRFEVIVADGMSRDRTREIVAAHAARHNAIRLIDNPLQTTPAALNAGLAAARGDVIMRMDAHVVYPTAYMPRLVAALLESGADNVGGVIATLPADQTPLARAIAVALSHPFGVGNSYFRIGVNQPRWVDNVAFGCWRRETFARVGVFDEEMVRNQDDEFNHRVIRAGGRILLIPDVVSRYFARRTLRQVGRMYYQYGYFKPLVAKKVGRVMTVRQLVPALFLASLAVTAVAGAWLAAGRLAFLAIAGSYLLAVTAVAVGTACRHGVSCGLAATLVFPTVHAAYGLGFFRGIWDHVLSPRRRRSVHAPSVPLSR